MITTSHIHGTLYEIKIKEIILDKELNEVLTALRKLKESMRDNNFSEDDMETQLLETLESAGIYFNKGYY